MEEPLLWDDSFAKGAAAALRQLGWPSAQVGLNGQRWRNRPARGIDGFGYLIRSPTCHRLQRTAGVALLLKSCRHCRR